MAVADFTTTRFRRSIAFNTCDSMHDFLKGPRCDPSPKSKLIEELNKKLTELIKAGFLDPVEVGTMYNTLTDESTISHPETAAKKLVGIPDIETQTVYVTNNDNALKVLQTIFGYFGHASIMDDNNPVKIVMDGGSGGLGALAKVLNTKVSIVNVVTPATACDSALLSTKDLFGNPILFESPFRPGVYPEDKPTEFSDAAFFSGSKITPQSDVYDSNTRPSCRIYVDDTVINLGIRLRGPPVQELCNAINNPAYQGPWGLNRFTTAQKFDLKRCADSDQIRYCKKLGHIFVTIDEICAYIAAYFYEVPTILQTHGAKGAKYFKLFKPNQGLAAMVGGSKTDSTFVIEASSMQQGGGNEDYEVPLDETEIFSTICGLASSTLLNGLSSSPAFKPLAAACSAFNLLQKTGMLQRSYVLQHNAIYPPPYNVHAGTTIDIVKTWVSENPLSKNDIITQLPPSEFASFIDDLKSKGIYPPPAGGLPSLLVKTYDFIEKYPNKNVVLLTLALVDAYITNPLSPQLSAIHTIIFHDILIPRNPYIQPLQNIPETDHVSAEISAIYSQLIDVFSTFIGDPTKIFSIGPGAMKLVAGGKRKKTHRNKLKRKRTKRNKNSKK